jgi:hypothetical protein
MEMHRESAVVRAGRIFMFLAALSLVFAANLGAQGRDSGQGPATRTPRAAALKDLTGYWESIITEDWRIRMIVPDKSDYVTVPLNAEGRKVADAWDPAKDQADGNQCRSYGAAALLRVPGRLHIYWQDDSTLRIDADSGTQTRLLHFGGQAPENKVPEWQGYSAASWEGNEPLDQRAGGGGPVLQGGLDSTGAPPELRKEGQGARGYLKVITTHMRPGYLRKNGVPYSGNATMEEFFDRFSDPYGGDTWLVVTTVVTDPQYLLEPFITHAHFKKMPDGTGWDPAPCRVDQPR